VYTARSTPPRIAAAATVPGSAASPTAVPRHQAIARRCAIQPPVAASSRTQLIGKTAFFARPATSPPLAVRPATPAGGPICQQAVRASAGPALHAPIAAITLSGVTLIRWIAATTRCKETPTLGPRVPAKLSEPVHHHHHQVEVGAPRMQEFAEKATQTNTAPTKPHWLRASGGVPRTAAAPASHTTGRQQPTAGPENASWRSHPALMQHLQSAEHTCASIPWGPVAAFPRLSPSARSRSARHGG